jgi:hypothetical protein
MLLVSCEGIPAIISALAKAVRASNDEWNSIHRIPKRQRIVVEKRGLPQVLQAGGACIEITSMILDG